MKTILRAAAGVAMSLTATPNLAQIAITEVAPWSSGNSRIEADWFELTNLGGTAVGISGWRMDDSSASAGSSRPLRGIASIDAGRSVIFLEADALGIDDAALAAAFVGTWFGGSAPTALHIGFYGGSGVGLSTGGDAVTVFDANGALQASVSFGASPAASPFATFDNSAGLDDVTLDRLTAAGINGAFIAPGSLGITEIGSPGVVAAIPEPETYALFLAGLGLVGALTRMRRR